MMIELAHENFGVSIDSLGAELKRLDDCHDHISYIFNGDPAWWNGSAPVLFPIIGGLNNGSYRFEAKTYQLGSHGFARKSEFTLKQRSSDSVTLELCDNDQTRLQYPFNFILSITFALEIGGLTVRYDVKNNGKDSMFFSIGSHPAFAIPFAGGPLEHYYVEFEQSEVDKRYLFVDGCIKETCEPVFNNSRQIFLTPHVFDKGPIILQQIVSRRVSIRKSRSSHSISIVYDAPNIAVWSKPNRAPFVCIEPWWGVPDPVGYSDSLEKKPGIIKLGSQETFSTRYSIEIS